MPIISRPPATAAKKAVTIRMPEPVAETLHQYARFVGSGLDYIVVEALKLVFKRDSEFKAWLSQQQKSPARLEAEDVQAAAQSTAVPTLFPERMRDIRRGTSGESRES